jgi:hypothetical protein
MPIFGELSLETVVPQLPSMANLDTELWALPKAEILQLAFEVGGDTLAILPRAMHPAIPAYATFHATRYPESPVGPFVLAQVRLMGRAGAHPRGLVLGAVATSEEAVAALRSRWGLPVVVGQVGLTRYHDQVTASVRWREETIFEGALVDPEPIAPGDVQYIASVTLAQVDDGGIVRPQLVQVDPHYTLAKAERGRPRVRRFVASAWNAGPLTLVHPISASMTTCDTDLPRIRFVMDPEVPVVRGTRRLR